MKKALKTADKAANKQAQAVAIEAMKMTAKTWKRDVTGFALNCLWVNSTVRADYIARVNDVKQDECKAGKDCIVIVNGSKGNVARAGQFDASGTLIRVRKNSGEYTGFVSLEMLGEIEGLKIETTDEKTLLSKFTKFARRSHAGTAYEISFADDSTQYFASARIVNGKVVFWHEESKRNCYNAHEVASTEKVLSAKESAFANGGKNKARTVRARKVAATK